MEIRRLIDEKTYGRLQAMKRRIPVGKERSNNNGAKRSKPYFR